MPEVAVLIGAGWITRLEKTLPPGRAVGGWEKEFGPRGPRGGSAADVSQGSRFAGTGR